MRNTIDIVLFSLYQNRKCICLSAMIASCTLLATGCASISNPVADGIPVRYLPPEVFGESKEVEKPIPLNYFRQPTNKIYRLAAGDVLGVWIEGVLGEKNTIPPVQASRGDQLPPSVGIPVPIREDGRIALPLVDPILVQGLSLAEAQVEIVRIYTKVSKILQPGRERIIITLQEPRKYHVLVAREDAGSVSIGSTGGFGGFSSGTSVSETHKSAGFPLQLPAYENDLLNALMKSGGLPGYDASNEIIIQRGSPHIIKDDSKENSGRNNPQNTNIRNIKIPLRMKPGEEIPIKPEDIILETGDIVYVRNRKGEVFYTAGLLPPRVFPLPKDRDIDVLEALVIVGAPLINGGLGVNNLSGNLTGSGLGNPSPSLVTILRRTESGGQIPIQVNLNLAFRDTRERVRIMPGDYIVLQYTPFEAISNYIVGKFKLDFFGTIVRQRDLVGTGNLGPVP